MVEPEPQSCAAPAAETRRSRSSGSGARSSVFPAGGPRASQGNRDFTWRGFNLLSVAVCRCSLVPDDPQRWILSLSISLLPAISSNAFLTLEDTSATFHLSLRSAKVWPRSWERGGRRERSLHANIQLFIPRRRFAVSLSRLSFGLKQDSTGGLELGVKLSLIKMTRSRKVHL